MLIKVLAPGYYARQDTRTPVRIGIMAMVANMVCNLIFIYPAWLRGGWFSPLPAPAPLTPYCCSRGSISRMFIALPLQHRAVLPQALGGNGLDGGLLAYLSPDLAQWGAWSMGKASLS